MSDYADLTEEEEEEEEEEYEYDYGNRIGEHWDTGGIIDADSIASEAYEIFRKFCEENDKEMIFDLEDFEAYIDELKEREEEEDDEEEEE